MALMGNLIPIYLRLRTRHLDVLELFAYRDACSINASFRALIDQAIQQETMSGDVPVSAPTQVARSMYRVTPDQLAFLDRVAARHGLPRVDISRRIIDASAAKFFAERK